MRVGLSTASFYNRVPTETAFDILRQMRIDMAEIFLSTFSEYEKPFVDALVSRRGSLNVYSVRPLGAQFEPQLFSPNARVRADAELIFRKVCYAATALGAKCYTFHGPTRLVTKDYSFDYAKIGERMNQLCDIAQSYGIRLSYENVGWSYFNFPDYFKNLSQYCPTLLATLNTKHALQSGVDVNKYLDAMEGRISTIHICDYVKDGTALPGQGKMNFIKFFKELDKRGINANVFVEAFARDYSDVNELKDSYDFVTDMLMQVKNGK